MKIGFDNEKYLRIQSEHIKERITQFNGKLYLELGGKLLTTIMRQEYCLVLNQTANSVCSNRYATALRL